MRLAPLRKAELQGEQSALYQALVARSLGRAESFALNERGEVRGPIAVLLHHPSSGRPLQELATVLRFSGLLPDASREAVILVVAASWNDEHEWTSHARIAREIGMTEEQLDSIRAGHRATFDNPATQAAFDAAYAMVSSRDLTDDQYAAVSRALPPDQIVEITVLVGYYSLLSLQLRVFRVPAT
jgi:4-carboxymuconolactone decarboxylase